VQRKIGPKIIRLLTSAATRDALIPHFVSVGGSGALYASLFRVISPCPLPKERVSRSTLPCFIRTPQPLARITGIMNERGKS
jgi:hypothetical protein